MPAPTFSGNPLIAPGNSAPVATCAIDPTSGLVYSPSCANYTALTTIGTSTVKSGNAGGIFWGFNAVSTGTAVMTSVPYDIAVTGTTTTTTQLGGQVVPTALGVFGQPSPGGVGVRFTGSLVVVTAGTAGTTNALWD